MKPLAEGTYYRPSTEGKYHPPIAHQRNPCLEASNSIETILRVIKQASCNKLRQVSRVISAHPIKTAVWCLIAPNLIIGFVPFAIISCFKCCQKDPLTELYETRDDVDMHIERRNKLLSKVDQKRIEELIIDWQRLFGGKKVNTDNTNKLDFLRDILREKIELED